MSARLQLSRLGRGMGMTLPLAIAGCLWISPTAVADDAAAPSQDDIVVQGLTTATTTASVQPNGEITVDSYPEQVNYIDDSGQWQTIDDTLVDSSDDSYAVENAANSFSAQLPEDASVTPIRVSSDSAWVSMRMVGIGDDAPEVHDDTATYNDVQDAASVDYAVTSSGLKESVNLTSPPAADDVLQYNYVIDASSGVAPKLATDGSIEFDGEDGGVVASIPAGVMFDSAAPAPATSGNISYRLEQSGDAWHLIVTPSVDWLTDSTRTYPVTVDPSITMTDPSSPTCRLNSSAPTTSLCNDGVNKIWAGASGGSARRSLLYFDMSIVPSVATLTSASVNLYLDASSTNSTATADYAFYRTSRRYDATANWNSAGAAGSWVGGSPSGSPNGTLSMNGQNDGWKNFDITSIASGWVNGTYANNGLVFKQVTESVDNTLWFYSSASSNDVSKMPFLSVTFNYPENGNVQHDADATPVLEADDPDAANYPYIVDGAKVNALAADGARPVDSVDSNNSGLSSPAPRSLSHEPTLSSYKKRKIHPAGQSYSSAITAEGTSHVKVPAIEYKAEFKNNHSRVNWLGLAVADTVTLAETFQTSGFNTSLSLSSSSAGVGLSGSGGVATATGVAASGGWYAKLDIDYVLFDGTPMISDVWKVRHTVVGTFRFGSATKVVTSTDAAIV